MEAVTELSTVRLAPVPEVVAALEEALERAKSGEIRGFIMATSADRACVATVFSLGDGHVVELLGATKLLEHRLLVEALQE